MSDRIPLIVKLAIGVAALLACIAITCLLMVKGPTGRENRLQELVGKMPGPGLSLAAKKKASEYGAGWMKAFSALGTSGIRAHGEQAYQELLPLVASFENGSPAERHVFATCELVHKAVVYAGANGAAKAGWPDPELNRLLRLPLPPDPLPDIPAISGGIGELLMDYMQIVEPSGFNFAYRLNQARGVTK